jgi:ABC-2 type transport system ATP-binding protein
MSNTVITVSNLSKTYQVPERDPGLVSSLKSLVKKKFRNVEAVRDITFSVGKGEIVGFIGPNGAGKTTTLKILSGLLHPTNGEATVLGYVPWRRESAYLSRISMVLGNKSQMLWDIPPLDTFQVLGEIYLDIEELLHKPVRNFSLGERMKCELVAGLLHRPDVMFLDEPTLGLDVSMQGRLRKFLAEYNMRSGVSVILTSHYMADVVALCPRVILIHQGKLLYDGELQGLADRLAPFKLVNLTFGNVTENRIPEINLPEGAEVIHKENGRITIRVSRIKTPSVTAKVLNELPVVDLSIENPPIEAVIDQIYQDGDL